MAPVSYFACAAEGNKLGSDRDAVDLIGEAQGADLILIPAFDSKRALQARSSRNSRPMGGVLRSSAIFHGISKEARHCAISSLKRTAAIMSGSSGQSRISNGG
jgi:hypothetical protein